MGKSRVEVFNDTLKSVTDAVFQLQANIIVAKHNPVFQSKDIDFSSLDNAIIGFQAELALIKNNSVSEGNAESLTNKIKGIQQRATAAVLKVDSVGQAVFDLTSKKNKSQDELNLHKTLSSILKPFAPVTVEAKEAQGRFARSATVTARAGEPVIDEKSSQFEKDFSANVQFLKVRADNLVADLSKYQAMKLGTNQTIASDISTATVKYIAELDKLHRELGAYQRTKSQSPLVESTTRTSLEASLKEASKKLDSIITEGLKHPVPGGFLGGKTIVKNDTALAGILNDSKADSKRSLEAKQAYSGKTPG